MKRFHACCPSHATSRVANRTFRSLALGSGGIFGLLFKIDGSGFIPPAWVYYFYCFGFSINLTM